MPGLSTIYRALFGKDHINDGSVIELSEHGRVGGVSTGQPFKYVAIAGGTTLVDEASTEITYIGKTKNGSATDTSSAIWQIKKVTESGTISTIAYADGDDKYDNIWANRASLTYT